MTLLIREADEVIYRAPHNPNVEMLAGKVAFHHRRQLELVYVMCKLPEIKHACYEFPFSCVDDVQAKNLLSVTNKSFTQIIFIGDTKNKVVRVDSPAFHAHLDALAQHILSKRSHGWSSEELSASIADVQCLSKNTANLWNLFIENGCMFNVRLK